MLIHELYQPEEKNQISTKTEVTKPTKGTASDEDEKPSDDEIAEHIIGSFESHEDRVFVRQCLIGIYGTKRLNIVKEYLNHWRLGVEAEPVPIKQENAGRHRANFWIRKERFNKPTTSEE